MPIYLTSSFVFDSTEHAAELFALRTYGNIYSRIGNPTVAAFEERIASLEGGLGAVATASGLAAQLTAILALAQAGDHIVATASLYGGTVTQFTVTLKRMGIGCTLVAGDDLAALEAAIQPNTRLVYTETIGNPLGNVADLEAIAAMAHAHGLPLVVDNTFASPALCRPIEWGADVVVQSATKFVGGHGTVIAGAIVESGTFPWGAGKHPLLSEPSPGYHDMNFAETFGEYAFLMRVRTEVLRDVGASLSPMNAFMLLQGLETGRAFIEALELWSHLANVGDAKSLVIHPASTTHQQLSDLEMTTSGVTPDMVRLSVGLEDASDLIWDLENGLRAAVAATGARA
jgi:O-acetylhomoserine (thiol)-lyase